VGVGSSCQRLSIILKGNGLRAQTGQRNNNLGGIQPRGVVGIEVGKNYKTGAVEDIGGGYQQRPTFRFRRLRIGIAERQVSGPKLPRDDKSDAIAPAILHSGSWNTGNGGSQLRPGEEDLPRACGERATKVAPRRSIRRWTPASACSSRTQKGHQSPQKKLTTTGPRSRRSERWMKPPRRYPSRNRGPLSPPFTALVTRPVSASASIDCCTASTTCGSALASHSRRQASS